MNIMDGLAGAKAIAQRDKIVNYVGSNPKRFGELIQRFLAGPYRITQHSSWPLSVCVQQHPELAKPYLKMLIGKLKDPHLHPAVKRNILRLLQTVAIPKRLQASAIDNCFALLRASEEPIAVHVFAMSVLANMANIYPDLKEELKLAIEDRMIAGGPAIQSRARKVLKQLA